jgi:RNA polymerase sigma-70 factor (ECF subfamily)
MNPENIRLEFEKTHKKYADAIFRYCYFKVSDREIAKDLTQETFIKFWEYWASGGKVDYIKSFLYRIASNSIIDHRRKKKTLSLEKMTMTGFDPANDSNEMEEIENMSEGAEAIKAVGELPEKYRDVLILRYVDDLSIKEIAEIIQEKENNISVRINRGLEKLKNILKKNG